MEHCKVIFVLQIAIGIVLAVLILRLLPLIIVSAAFLLSLGLIVGLIVGVVGGIIFLGWQFPEFGVPFGLIVVGVVCLSLFAEAIKWWRSLPQGLFGIAP